MSWSWTRSQAQRSFRLARDTMCVRKIFIHHRCGHRITELLQICSNVECKRTKKEEVITNKYACINMQCGYYGQF